MASSPTSGLRLFAYLASAALIAARPAGELTEAESLDGVVVDVALDQANEPYNLSSGGIYTGAVPGGQTFTAGMNGELSRASVYVQKECLPDCPHMLLQPRTSSSART